MEHNWVNGPVGARHAARCLAAADLIRRRHGEFELGGNSMKVQRVAGKRNGERGITLVLVAFGMTMFIAAAAFAIDLASLYVGKSESQRAADAAALAGAQQTVALGLTSTTLTG